MSDRNITHDEALSTARRAGLITDPPPPGLALFKPFQPAEEKKAPPPVVETPDPVLDPEGAARALKAELEKAVVDPSAGARPPGHCILESHHAYNVKYGSGRDRPGVTVRGVVPPSELALPLLTRRAMRIDTAPFYVFSEAECKVLDADSGFRFHVVKGEYKWHSAIPESAYDRESKLERELIRLRSENARMKADLETVTSPDAT
jgi:hypothetical protein